jgi:CheY-like chemotaxis protein
MKMKDSSDASAKRWMVVDDDEGALAYMREMVSKLGVKQIECFTNGEDALTAFKAAPESYELVITDFQMPEMDGVELSRRILTITPRTKVLLMTGSNLFNDAVAAREGFSGFLKKPFHVTALQRVLDAIAAGKFSTDLPAK